MWDGRRPIEVDEERKVVGATVGSDVPAAVLEVEPHREELLVVLGSQRLATAVLFGGPLEDVGDELEVVGSGGITIIDPSDLKYSSMDKARRGEPVSLIGVKLHILVAGGRFEIESRDAFAE